MYQPGCNAYRQSAGNLVEDNKVILLKLYDGTLRFLSVARRGIIEQSPSVRGENISKAMAIVNELDCALDMKKGGDLSSQLASLYRFVMDKLTLANSKNDVAALDKAEDILKTRLTSNFQVRAIYESFEALKSRSDVKDMRYKFY